MSKTSKTTREGRRDFLKGMAAVGGAATVAAAAGGAIAGTAQEPEATPAQAKPKGYHLTPHIRAYYDKARF